MTIEPFYDKETGTLTYIVWDEKTLDTAIIDPVMNYDPKSSTISYNSISQLRDFIESNLLNPKLILETHAHADHLSGSQKLKELYPSAKLAIGKEIQLVQKTFAEVFNLKEEISQDGSQFDVLYSEGDIIEAGTLKFQAIHTPGHTPACYSFTIDDAVFTGDALFMPDSGVGRCDFPMGDANSLYHSVHEKLFELPDETKVYVGHDYQPEGRPLEFQSTIGDQKKFNIHIRQDTGEEEFVQFRTKRDSTLAAPRLLLQSVQVNINGGKFLKPETNGLSYLKIPVREGK